MSSVVCVSTVSVPLSNDDFLDRIRDVDGSGSGIDADTIDGLNSNQFLRSEGNITTGGSVTTGGDLFMGANKIHFQSDPSDSALIYVTSSSKLNSYKFSRSAMMPITTKFACASCAAVAARDIMVARSHDIKFEGVNVEVNGRFFMPRSGYYFKIQRPTPITRRNSVSNGRP